MRSAGWIWVGFHVFSQFHSYCFALPWRIQKETFRRLLFDFSNPSGRQRTLSVAVTGACGAGLRFSHEVLWPSASLQDVQLPSCHALIFHSSACQTRCRTRFLKETPYKGLAICSGRADCSVRTLMFGKMFERVGPAPSL